MENYLRFQKLYLLNRYNSVGGQTSVTQCYSKALIGMAMNGNHLVYL